LSKVYFELRNFMSYVCHASKDVTGQQAQREFVRVVKSDRVADRQVERCRDRRGRSHRTPNIRCPHRRLLRGIPSGDRTGLGD